MRKFIKTEVRIQVGVYAEVEPGMHGDLIDPPEGPFVEIEDVVGLRGQGAIAEVNLLPFLCDDERELLRDLVREQIEYPGYAA